MGYRDTITAHAPTAYWRLAEQTGTTAADERGVKSGVYTNAPTLGSAGLLAADTDTAVSFDGTNDWVNVGDAPALRLTGAKSVEAWIKPTSVPAAGSGVFRSVVAKDGNYGIQFNNDRLEWWIVKGGTKQRCQAPSGAVVAGTTYHVVGTYDGLRMRLYLNGKQAASLAVAGPTDATAAALAIGSYDGTTEYYQGVLDEVAVYPAALSSSQVGAHLDAAVTTSLPAPGPGVPAWAAHFEGTMADEWDVYDNVTGTSDYPPGITCVDAAAEGVPGLAAYDGQKVGKFQKTATDIATGLRSAKVYRQRDWPKSDGTLQAGQVDGIYRAQFFLPAAEVANFQAAGAGYQNIFQYKWSDTSIAGDTVPSWWVNLTDHALEGGFSGPGLMVSCNNPPGVFLIDAERPAPIGRWFEIAAYLYHGDRIDFYLDGAYWCTGHHAIYPVAPDNGKFWWTFGVGNYGSAAATLYVDGVTYAPHAAAAIAVHGGFARDTAGRLAYSTAVSGEWHGGFVRDPDGKVLFATTGVGTMRGGLVRDSAGRALVSIDEPVEGWHAGFARAADGRLAVTSASSGLTMQGGFMRDSAGRLAVTQ